MSLGVDATESPDTYVHQYSSNDVLALEIEAAGTQFEAGTSSKDAFASLIDGDQWMIYRNVETGVLHWDFVSLCYPILAVVRQHYTIERAWTLHQFPSR